MPLRKTCDIKAFQENIKAEINAGREPAQALAIAHRTLREACKAAGKPIPRTDSAISDLELETVQRYDFTPIGNAQKTSQGFLKFGANLTRTGVLTYKKADGSVQKELRHPDEVFDPESLETLSGAPVTDLHSAMINPSNVREFSAGIVGESVSRKDEFAAGSVTVMDQSLIDKIQSGERKEGSPGYTCILDWTPGTYNGEKFDAIQRNIRYNHWAIGPNGWGRQGSNVALRLDGDAAASLENPEPGNPEPKRNGENSMKRKIRIDGVEYELDSDSANQAIQNKIEKLDSAISDRDKKLSELQGKFDGIVKERDELKKKLDTATDPKTVDALVNARANLISDARKVLGAEEKLDGKTSREIKVSVLKKLDEKFDDSGRDDSYIDGLFDYSVKNHQPESKAGGVGAARKAATPKKDEKNKDQEIDKYDSSAAEKRMLERSREAWKSNPAAS